LLLLLVVSAFGTLLVQRQVQATQVRLRNTLRPAQVAVAMLGEAYVDQETGARGYELTGDKALLGPYRSGQSKSVALQQTLAKEIAGDPQSLGLLAQVADAGTAWRDQVLILVHAFGQNTPPPQSTVRTQALAGKKLFDTLRARLTLLSGRINLLAAQEVEDINTAQATANWLTVAAGVAGLILLVVAALVLRNSLSRPLTRLVAQVQRVADGDLGHSVDISGPEELATVGSAVETMRVRILAQTARAMEMQRQIDVTEETERISQGLQDLVVRRLSGTGLILQSAASRYPATAAALSEAVDEIDKAIRELRAVVFGLTTRKTGARLHERVLSLVSESENSLGFSPRLQFDGTLETALTQAVADELMLVLREILSNIATHADASEADISLGVTDGVLQLRVTDNGNGPRPGAQGDRAGIGLAGLAASAERLGGTCTVGRAGQNGAANGQGGAPGTAAGGGTVVEWNVPVDGPSPG
jgi:signal transduction histidine kinase